MMKIKAVGIVCVIIVTALVVTSLTPRIDHDTEVSYGLDNVGYVDVGSTDFPSSFDLRDVNGVSYVTSVKNQGKMGTCWAFSATSVLETAAISAGLATDDLDLSEVQYVYFSHKGVSSEGDSMEFYNGNDFINGGYLEESMFNYGQWEGKSDRGIGRVHICGIGIRYRVGPWASLSFGFSEADQRICRELR